MYELVTINTDRINARFNYEIVYVSRKYSRKGTCSRPFRNIAGNVPYLVGGLKGTIVRIYRSI